MTHGKLLAYGRTAFVFGLAVMFARSGSAAEAMSLGPEQTIVPSPPDDGAQIAPDVAYGDGTYLVVWQQGQRFYEGTSPLVFATRLDASGTVLDAIPIRLCNSPGAQERPRVRFSNGVFLVVWQDFRSQADWDLYANRVAPDGSLLDGSGGFLLAGGEHNQVMADVAEEPEGFLVVWQDFRDGQRYRLYAAHVAADGVVAEPGGAVLQRADGSALAGGTPAVARIGRSWLVAFTTGREHYMARVDDDLTVLETAVLPSLMGRKRPSRLFGGGDSALCASTFRAGHGGPANPAVGAIFREGSAVAVLNPNTEKPNAGLGTDGWSSERMIVLRDAALGAQGDVDAAFDGEKYLATFRGYQETSGRVGAMRIGPDGARIDTEDGWTVLNPDTASASSPVVAASGPNEFLVVYMSASGPAGLSRLKSRRITAR